MLPCHFGAELGWYKAAPIQMVFQEGDFCELIYHPKVYPLKAFLINTCFIPLTLSGFCPR